MGCFFVANFNGDIHLTFFGNNSEVKLEILIDKSIIVKKYKDEIL